MSDLHIYVRDVSRNRIAEIDDFQTLKVVTKWTDNGGGTSTNEFGSQGSWTITIPGGTAVSKLLDNDQAGIIIERDGETLISGPVGMVNPQYKNGYEIVNISGPDESVWLTRRSCIPCLPPYNDTANDVQSGLAETVIKHYVDFNLGPGTQAGRGLSGFHVAPDQHRGSTVSASTRFDMLNTVLTNLALAGGDLGYGITLGPAGYGKTDLVFDVSQGRDRSNEVSFSLELGNINEYDYERSLPDANAVIVGGSGQGTARLFTELVDQASITQWGRLEGPLVDERNSNDPAYLLQSGQKALTTSAAKNSIAVTAVSIPSIAYRTHWQLGDKVTVILNDQPVVDTIREIDFTWDKDKAETINPIIGTPGRTRPKMPKLFATQRSIANRVSLLESRL